MLAVRRQLVSSFKEGFACCVVCSWLVSGVGFLVDGPGLVLGGGFWIPLPLFGARGYVWILASEISCIFAVEEDESCFEIEHRKCLRVENKDLSEHAVHTGSRKDKSS